MQKPLNIAVNTRFLIHNKLEGIGRFTFETLKRMSLAHPQHRFYCIFDRPPHQQFLFAENIIPLIANPPARHPFLWYWWFEWSVPRILKKINADVFLSPDGFASLNTNIPQLTVMHDIAFEHYPQFVPFITKKYYRYYSPKFAHKVQRIATVSDFSKQDISVKYNIDLDKIDVVYNGANPSCKPINETEKQKVKEQYSHGCNYFIFISAVHPRKNLGRILQAFDIFKTQTQSSTKLIVAGRMAWKNEELKTIYQKMEHKNEVVFVGHLAIKEIERLIASATALCYASLFEGFGLPILEAMYAETPVITSTVSSMPEVAGEAALLVNPKDVDSISKAFLALESQPKLQQKLIEAGKIQRQKFTWEQTAKLLWESVLKTLN